MQSKYYSITSPTHVDAIRLAIADQTMNCALIEQGHVGHVTYTLVLHAHRADMIDRVESEFAGMIVECAWPE